MVISFLVALWFQFAHERVGLPALDPAVQLVLGVVITTAVWILVTLLTRPVDTQTLQAFYDRIRPAAGGWQRAVETGAGSDGSVVAGLASWALGCLAVYSALFGIGMALYGRIPLAIGFAVAALVSGIMLFRTLPKVGFE